MATKPRPEDIPGFFKVLLGDFYKRLQIPPAFAKFFYQTPLPHKIKLQNLEKACCEWRVEVVEIDKKLFFKKGWKEFVQDNRLETGDFIFFSCVERSLFQFTVFGKDGCVKDVIVKRKKKQRETVEKNIDTIEERHGNVPDKNVGVNAEIKDEDTDAADEEDAISVEILGKKRKRTESTEGNRDDSVDVNCKRRKVHHKNIKKIARKETSLILKRAKEAFKSKNPFFMVAVQPSYIGVGKNNTMNVPLGFAERYFNKERRNVILELHPDGKTWDVKYYTLKRNNRRQTKLNSGWLDFAIENHLEVGDVCAFELINRARNILRVYILKDI